MHASGVICEFNPIHTGHVHLLTRMREAVGEDGCVICLMSGRFVQRGTAAVADPYLRADMALSAGADLVLELPFPWSVGSAEHFARAGVEMLTRLGVESIAFGSECGDKERLTRAAAAVADPAFGELYAALTRSGLGSTAAYIEAVRRFMNSDYALSQKDNFAPSESNTADFPASNDLLGIAYLRALADIDAVGGGVPCAVVIRREGADYHDTVLPADTHPSATALRILLREAAEDPVALVAALDGTMPTEALTALLAAVERGEAPIDDAPLLAFCHAHYRLADPNALALCAECGGGVAAHIIRCAQKASSPQDFFHSLRTRRYTDARLRRALLFGVLGVTDRDLRATPTYTTLLAATPRGCAYLAALRRETKRTADTDAAHISTDIHIDTHAVLLADASSASRFAVATAIGAAAIGSVATDDPVASPATAANRRQNAQMEPEHRERDRGGTVADRGSTVTDFSKDPPNSSFCRMPLPVVTKPADAPAGRQTELALRADALFTLCYPTPRAAGELLRRSPIIRA